MKRCLVAFLANVVILACGSARSPESSTAAEVGSEIVLQPGDTPSNDDLAHFDQQLAQASDALGVTGQDGSGVAPATAATDGDVTTTTDENEPRQPGVSSAPQSVDSHERSRSVEDSGTCSERYRLRSLICQLGERMCVIARRHNGEPDYQSRCDLARDRCTQAQTLCSGCRC